jgi:carboxyl-terminal processing protease
MSVVAAAALIFSGLLLGMAPGVNDAVSEALGFDQASDVGLDYDLQEEVFEDLSATYYEQVDPEIVQTGAINGMLAALGDPYTVYYDPEEYASLMEETAGSYSGVGMVVGMEERIVTIVSVFEGSPAEAADIQPGDIVLSVDGVSSEGRTLDDVVSGIKGPEGSPVVLEMYRPAAVAVDTAVGGGTAEEAPADEDMQALEDITADLSALPEGGTTEAYTLTRRAIVVPTTEVEMLRAEGDKVAHITLYTFNNDHASQELRDAVATAIEDDGADAIILDLRGNGGGLLTASIEVASIFIESGVIVSTAGLHSPEEEFTASGNAFEDIPLWVLVDENTASASEIVAGALQDYGRATIVGETTFGKGLVQSLYPLSNGGALKVTTAVYLTPTGRDINATGIVPDIAAPDDPATEDVDETVQKALELITGASAGR